MELLSRDIEKIQVLLENMKSKIEKRIEKKQQHILSNKIQLLHQSFQSIENELDETISILDATGSWSLSKNDIERIQNNREAKNIQNIFLPYMLYYKIVSDILNT